MIRQPIPSIFRPLVRKHRYKICYGGRGSGKTQSICELLIEISRKGRFGFLCCRELQKSINDSVIKVLTDIIDDKNYIYEFEIQRNKITNLHTGSWFIFIGLKNNPTAVKSIEGVDICFIEEAENVSEESWNILIPTIRRESSEIWINFNPKNILDATYQKFVTNPPSNSVLIKANYTDNPYFPDVLKEEMEECRERDFDLYRHIWLGEPVADSELAIIKPSWIEAAVDSDKKLELDLLSGDSCLGFDVADEGEDKNAFCVRKGATLVDMAHWGLGDIMHSTDKVNNYALMNSIDRIIYDSIGIGAGVKAYLRRLNSIKSDGFNAGAAVHEPDTEYISGKTNKDMFENLKAQAWWNVRNRFENTYLAVKHGRKFKSDQLICIKSNIKELEYLKAELSRPQIQYSKNGKVMCESKEHMKKRGIKSPNLADAFVMAFSSSYYRRMKISNKGMMRHF